MEQRSVKPLPIDAVLPQIIAALRDGNAAVLRAPTGAGKTTRVAPAILDAGLSGSREILLLQPRRLAARAAAWRMADERGSPLGGEIGYQVRFERKAGRQTRILVMTEGLLIRRLQDDPLLESVGAVLFDEFHERSLDADLALAIARRLQAEVRPDLKLLVMSATLDPAPVARFLGDCPRIEAEGRLHPVEVSYLKHDDRAPIHVKVANGVTQIAAQTSGDVLAFLPGVGEIRRTGRELADFAAENDFALMQLYGDLPLDEQQAVLRPAERRKIVLATNVAETSVTIEGIAGVVDSGLARVNRRDPALGINRLEISRISRASADQRAGRAGRMAPGVCLRLWTQAAHRALAEHELPEIARVDLAGAILHLLSWGETELMMFPWFEPPATTRVEQAIELLWRLGTIEASRPPRLANLGRRVANLPAEPRIGRLLIEGADFGHPRRAALAAALLAERDPFTRRTSGAPPTGAAHWSNSDVVDRLVAVEDFERSRKPDSQLGHLDSGAAKFILRAAEQFQRELNANCSPQEASSAETGVDPDEAIRRALLAAYPDRVARRRDATGRRANRNRSSGRRRPSSVSGCRRRLSGRLSMSSTIASVGGSSPFAARGISTSCSTRRRRTFRPISMLRRFWRPPPQSSSTRISARTNRGSSTWLAFVRSPAGCLS